MWIGSWLHWRGNNCSATASAQHLPQQAKRAHGQRKDLVVQTTKGMNKLYHTTNRLPPFDTVCGKTVKTKPPWQYKHVKVSTVSQIYWEKNKRQHNSGSRNCHQFMYLKTREQKNLEKTLQLDKLVTPEGHILLQIILLLFLSLSRFRTCNTLFKKKMQ